ncbi:MAG: M2 family metallopeptidase [Rubrobacter sp.]|nr:M2 family metallopeptidase [Rubrobacter sp.]
MSISAEAAQSFVSKYEGLVAPKEKAVGEAWWRLATTGSDDARKNMVEAGKAYNEVFSDASDFAEISRFHEERDALEPILRRQVEVLHRTFAGSQGEKETLENIEELEAKANSVYSNHRGVVGGEEVGENRVRSILRSSDDEALRREAWEASKTVGREVEPTVRELARLRNEVAREQGYENHYFRSLALQEIEAEELEGIMSGLKEATDEPFRELKDSLDSELKEKFGAESVMPWHLFDPFFQEPPETDGLDTNKYYAGGDLESLTVKTYDNLGLDVRGVLRNSDLYERGGKDQHAFCLHVGRDFPYDVRVLANLRPGNPDSYWANTMLHEFGHAVYDRHIDPSLPFFLRTVAHTNSTEAIALMMDGLTEDPGWLKNVARVPEEDIDEERLAARRRADGLVFVRWAMVMYRFEQILYENPDREDLNDVWWDLVEEIQFVNRPPERDEPDWAAKIHVAVAPVYYHNYVIGELIAAQLRHYMESSITHGPFYLSESAGRFLLESFFGPGARDDWRDTVERATGEKLNPKHFAASLV